MAKRLLKTMILPLTVMATAVAFVACGGDDAKDGTPTVKYKVTYAAGADITGTVPTETDKAAGEKFILKSADGMSYADKAFTGWNDGSATYKAGAQYTMPAKNVTFTAQWGGDDNPIAYTVTYKYGSGEDVVKTNQVAENYTVENPTEYVDSDLKVFVGWAVEGGNTVLPNSKLTLIGDTTFTAQWVEFDGENEWTDTTGDLQLMLLNDKVGACNYQNIDEEYVWTYFTYTLDGTAITVTPVGGTAATGTLEDGDLTIGIKVGMITYNFTSQQALPTFTFGLNGGTGTAPTLTVTDEMYEGDKFVVTLPANTITPPSGKEFNEWLVKDSNGGERRVKAGATYTAYANSTYTVTPVWKDVAQSGGTDYYGNCSIKILFSTVTVKALKVDTENGKVSYRTDKSTKYVEANGVTDATDDADKPTAYGATAKMYEVGIENYTCMVLIAPDGSKVMLFDGSKYDDDGKYKPFDNNEFTTTPPAPATYTVTYTNPNGATGTIPAVVTVEEGTEVTLAAATQFTKEGMEFQGWKVNNSSTLKEANEKITIEANTTVVPVFGTEYTDTSTYAEKWIVRDDGYVYYVFGKRTFRYTLTDDIIRITGFSDWEEGRIDTANKKIYVRDAYAGLTATAENGATLTLDGYGVATLDTHEGTYTVGGSWSAPMITITFGTVVIENVEPIDSGWVYTGLNINATITLGGTEYVFGSAETEPVVISRHFVGTFNGTYNGTNYVVNITLTDLTVTIGNAAPVEAQVTDYDDWNGITFTLGQDEWYIVKESGFDDDVDSIRMMPAENIRNSFVLGRPTDAIKFDPEYCGTFVGGGYTVVITKYAVTVQNGEAEAMLAVIEEYDAEGMAVITLDGDLYNLYMYGDTMDFDNEEGTVDVSLTRADASEGNGVPEKFYGYFYTADWEYGIIVSANEIYLTINSSEYEATSVEYYNFFGMEGIYITANGVDYEIQLDTEAGGQATSLKLFVSGAETPLATLTPVEW
ncbi:MAG: hypothetical protein K2F90_00630 [Clostridiales bacterium]|nr:hypothetical protein [Clostridiales bacterium]